VQYRAGLTIGLWSAIAVATSGCGGVVDPDLETRSVKQHATDTTGAAEFEVEVRYAGGLTEADARALLAALEIRPAQELFPGLKVDGAPASVPATEPLDASEPTFEVNLHPLNDMAASRLYAWHSSSQPGSTTDLAQADSPGAGSGEVGQTRQAIGVDDVRRVFQILFGLNPYSLLWGQFLDHYVILEWLSVGERWRTPRYRCRGFAFAADFAGVANACVDLGYDGVADHSCSLGYRPDEPVIVAHPGPDWDPWNEHYFRGRVTAVSFYGQGTGAELLGAATLCL
jgi:hypothetical protein